MVLIWRQRLSDCVSAPPFFFLRRKKNSKRKSCKGDAPLTPAVGRDTTTAWGSSVEDSVQAAQRGQVRARTVKHSAANFPWLPLKGKPRLGSCRAARRANRFCPEYRNFLRCVPHLCRLSLPACPFPGGLGGRSRIEFIVSPLSRRRHNESHFAAQSPERSFFFPLFLSPRKKKRLLAATQSENLCHQIKIRQKQSDTFFHSAKEGLKGDKRREKEGKNRRRQNEKSMLYCYRTR